MANEIITPMQMYWLTRLTSFGSVLAFIVFLLFCFAVGYFVAGLILQDSDFSDSYHQQGKKLLKTAPLFAVVGVVFIFVNCLLPTTRDMAAILIVPRIANSEKVQTVGNQLYDLAVEWMDELHPRKKTEQGKR